MCLPRPRSEGCVHQPRTANHCPYHRGQEKGMGRLFSPGTFGGHVTCTPGFQPPAPCRNTFLKFPSPRVWSSVTAALRSVALTCITADPSPDPALGLHSLLCLPGIAHSLLQGAEQPCARVPCLSAHFWPVRWGGNGFWNGVSSSAPESCSLPLPLEKCVFMHSLNKYSLEINTDAPGYSVTKVAERMLCGCFSFRNIHRTMATGSEGKARPAQIPPEDLGLWLS